MKNAPKSLYILLAGFAVIVGMVIAEEVECCNGVPASEEATDPWCCEDDGLKTWVEGFMMVCCADPDGSFNIIGSDYMCCKDGLSPAMMDAPEQPGYPPDAPEDADIPLPPAPIDETVLVWLFVYGPSYSEDKYQYIDGTVSDRTANGTYEEQAPLGGSYRNLCGLVGTGGEEPNDEAHIHWALAFPIAPKHIHAHVSMTHPQNVTYNVGEKPETSRVRWYYRSFHQMTEINDDGKFTGTVREVESNSDDGVTSDETEDYNDEEGVIEGSDEREMTGAMFTWDEAECCKDEDLGGGTYGG